MAQWTLNSTGIFLTLGVVVVDAVVSFVQRKNIMTGQEALSTLNSNIVTLEATLARVQALPTDEALAKGIVDATSKITAVNDALTVLAPLPVVPAGE